MTDIQGALESALKTLLDSSGEPVYQPQPSGKFCKGYSFDLPNLQLATGRGLGVEPGVVKIQARSCRWCIWDGRLSDPKNEGDECADCSRIVKDKYIGTIPVEHIAPISAVSVYLEPIAQWVNVEVVELPID